MCAHTRPHAHMLSGGISSARTRFLLRSVMLTAVCPSRFLHHDFTVAIKRIGAPMNLCRVITVYYHSYSVAVVDVVSPFMYISMESSEIVVYVWWNVIFSPLNVPVQFTSTWAAEALQTLTHTSLTFYDPRTIIDQPSVYIGLGNGGTSWPSLIVLKCYVQFIVQLGRDYCAVENPRWQVCHLDMQHNRLE